MSGPALPSSIGRYRPTGVLGTGAMGTVFKAHDPAIDRMVAIKVVRTEALDAETRALFIERFRLEVQAAARCAHPAIVAVHDFVGDAGNPAIVMELVEGRGLDRILHDPMQRSAVVAILHQVLGGLGYAHGQGVTHRDIKPANIIVTPSGQAKIADFGIARLNGTSLTAAGAILGTPAYMAPEQVADEAVDRRADLFSVGAILYEAFAGRPPFAGKTVADTLVRLSNPTPADMAPIEAAGAGSLVPVLRMALAKQPAQRFQSVDEFAAALAAAMAPRGSANATIAAIPTVVPGIGETMARRWDPALLQRLERQLTQYLGPIARLTVARAADRAADPEQLYATIAESLRNAADRTAFLRGLGATRVEQTLAGTQRLTQTAAKPATVPGAAVTIPPEAATAAQAVLAHFVGPIARMLVREASTQAVSGKDFLDRLSAHVTRPNELAELRRRMRAEVEPKLTG
jgi:serine/threonine-protein kinase